jgi:Ca2+-binding EF-hand superfamily protein/predicted DNA-binding protein
MSKKTESVEFRLSPELKENLARRVAADGQTMSGYLRDLVSQDMADVSVAADGVSHNKGDTQMKKELFKSSSRLSLMALPVLILAGGYLTSASMPAQASSDARVAFAELDSNGDGQVTETEYLAFNYGDEPAMPPVPEVCAGSEVAAEMSRPVKDMLREDMAHMDANADKVITYDELEAVMQREAVETFLEADEDGNGLVTVDEVIAYENAEEQLVPEELAQDLGASVECVVALQDTLEKWEAEWNADVVAMGDDAGEELDLSTLHGARLFIAEYDEDRDGRLSLSEVVQN